MAKKQKGKNALRKVQEDQSQYLHVAIRDPAVYEAATQKINDQQEINMFLLFSAKPALRAWVAMKRDRERIVPGYFLGYTTMRGVILASGIFGRIYPALAKRR